MLLIYCAYQVTLYSLLSFKIICRIQEKHDIFQFIDWNVPENYSAMCFVPKKQKVLKLQTYQLSLTL